MLKGPVTVFGTTQAYRQLSPRLWIAILEPEIEHALSYDLLLPEEITL